MAASARPTPMVASLMSLLLWPSDLYSCGHRKFGGPYRAPGWRPGQIRCEGTADVEGSSNAFLMLLSHTRAISWYPASVGCSPSYGEIQSVTSVAISPYRSTTVAPAPCATGTSRLLNGTMRFAEPALTPPAISGRSVPTRTRTPRPRAAKINRWTPWTAPGILTPADRSLTPSSNRRTSGWYLAILSLSRDNVAGSPACSPRQPALMTTIPDVAGSGGSVVQSVISAAPSVKAS